MKAKEYYASFQADLLDAGTRNTATKRLFYAMNLDVMDMAKQRNVQFDRGLLPIMGEANDKWNAIARLFKKEYGYSPIAQNGYKKLWIGRMPELRCRI